MAQAGFPGTEKVSDEELVPEAPDRAPFQAAFKGLPAVTYLIPVDCRISFCHCLPEAVAKLQNPQWIEPWTAMQKVWGQVCSNVIS